MGDYEINGGKAVCSVCGGELDNETSRCRACWRQRSFFRRSFMSLWSQSDEATEERKYPEQERDSKGNPKELEF